MNAHDSDASRSEQRRRLAVCLSGGGHRATLFGLGALIYLVDSEVNHDVTSLASVSGGSLTNGFVGQNLDFKSTASAEFEEKVAKPLASQIANRGTLFAPFATKLYLAALILGVLVVFAPFAVVWVPWYVRLLASLVLLWPWSWLFGLRGVVCARAFERTLFSPSGRRTRLADMHKEVDHVICATELRAAGQVYFSQDFVYSYMIGHGRPANLALARAVQASAAFPGGFPPAKLATKPHHFEGAPSHGGPSHPPGKLVLSDGGVYDNMAEQWARGFKNRAKRWRELEEERDAPSQLMVVNSSARVPWSPFKRGAIPVVGEVAALIRVNDVMYVNTTNVRRQEIVASYDPLHPDESQGLPGALVQIAQSPFDVADGFNYGDSEPAKRAREVIAALGEKNRDTWDCIARRNARVPTTLSRLGRDASALLLYQGYVVAMCNMYVIFGEKDFPLLPIPTLDDFLALVQ
ncbi:MAG: patatin-like phospholipase family protein [Planctomycetota bacterium]|jgi:hypothetical protein